MAKTSKVTNVVSAGAPYTGQYGTLYGFYVTFENGDNGKYNSKSPDQTKFIVGQEATYDYIPREYNGKTYFTVKPVNPEYANNNGGGGYTPKSGGSKDELIVRQTALKAAADLGGTPSQVLLNAQLFCDWVLQKEAAVAGTTHQAHLQGREANPPQAQPQAPAPVPVDADGLPF